MFLRILAAAAFTLVAGAVLYHTRSPQTALIVWTIALALALVCRVLPAFLRLTYTIWMCAAYPMGWLVSHVVLLVVFAFVITPMGLILRLLRRDGLSRSFDKSLRTYWQPRELQSDKTLYLKQS